MGFRSAFRCLYFLVLKIFFELIFLFFPCFLLFSSVSFLLRLFSLHFSVPLAPAEWTCGKVSSAPVGLVAGPARKSSADAPFGKPVLGCSFCYTCDNVFCPGTFSLLRTMHCRERERAKGKTPTTDRHCPAPAWPSRGPG